jgi:hypothetical protein
LKAFSVPFREEACWTRATLVRVFFSKLHFRFNKSHRWIRIVFLRRSTPPFPDPSAIVETCTARGGKSPKLHLFFLSFFIAFNMLFYFVFRVWFMCVIRNRNRVWEFECCLRIFGFWFYHLLLIMCFCNSYWVDWLYLRFWFVGAYDS